MRKRRDHSTLVLLHGEIKTPPLSESAREEVGRLLRRVQSGRHVEYPASRPMPDIASGVHELRINDDNKEWRIIYRIVPGEIVVADVFRKTTEKTPVQILDRCRRRFKEYENRI